MSSRDRADMPALLRRSDLSGHWYVVTRYGRTREAILAYEKHEVTRDVMLIQRLAQAEVLRDAAAELLGGKFTDPVDPADVARWLLGWAAATEPNGECPNCGLGEGHAAGCWYQRNPRPV